MTEEKTVEEKGAYDPSKHMMPVSGRNYLPAAQRVVWFRDKCPSWTIETEIVRFDPDAGVAVFRAGIRDETGRLYAQATKMETRQGFPDYLEKAETGAISRALSFCGYGTAFALDLDEGGRLSDAPQGGGRPGGYQGGRQGGSRAQAQPAAPAEPKPEGCKCAGKGHSQNNPNCPLNSLPLDGEQA